MKCLALHLCLEVVFPLRKQYYQEVLLNLVGKKNKSMFYQNQQNAIFQQVLIYECFKVHMSFLLL
jgi:hypothetical protein